MKTLKQSEGHAPFHFNVTPSLLALCLFVPLLQAAEEKKDEKKKEPPKILTASPFAIVPGATNKLVIRGLLLTNTTEIRFPSNSNLSAEIKSRGKASLADKADPKKFGDTQLDVELALPADQARRRAGRQHLRAGDLPFTVSTPDGQANTNLLCVVSKELLFDEKEPNPGFRKPNDISVPQSVRGIVGEANDVDVFRFQGHAQQRIVIETKSTRYGSSLDPLVTLYDASGHVLATSDDARGLDARIAATLPREGAYFLAINDAHDRGGATYTYVIEITGETGPATTVSAKPAR